MTLRVWYKMAVASYNSFKSEFSSELSSNPRIEIMTMDGGHMIQDHTLQIENKTDHLLIWNVNKTKKIMVLYEEHILGYKLR